MNIYTAAITLFLVMNPLGNMPVFISTLQHINPRKRLRIIVREALFALIILTVFLLVGRPLLQGLQVTQSALGIGGGIVLFIIAIRLIFPLPIKERSAEPESEPFLVPLAVPLFAGPATMATVMLLVNQTGHIGFTFIALIIAWIAASSLLLISTQLSQFLGKRGIIALERLMGMILITIAIQMLLNGVDAHFHLGLMYHG